MESFTLPNYENNVYTSCYCEENIYLLLKRFLGISGCEQQWDFFCVFISNPTRTVALWNQRMGASEDAVTIWDYHVVLALREHPQARSPVLGRERGTWIYDLDTNLPVPCYWKQYVDQTFPLGIDTALQYQSLFRVIPGEVYLDNFASDRSHMLDACVDNMSNSSEESRYFAKPPPYPAICGPEAEKNGVSHNLMTHFVSMMIEGDEGFGTVMDFDTFTTWCSAVTEVTVTQV